MAMNRKRWCHHFALLVGAALCLACTDKAIEPPMGSGGSTGSSAGGNSGAGPGPGPQPQPITPSTQPAPIDSVAPLPPSAFPFFRLRYVQSARDWRTQIWAYDRESNTEKLISALDDAVKGGELSGPPTLSPDRKWVLFASTFRSPKENYKPGLKLIWKVRVDGGEFVQMTPLPPDPRPPCNNNSECKGLAERFVVVRRVLEGASSDLEARQQPRNASIHRR